MFLHPKRWIAVISLAVVAFVIGYQRDALGRTLQSVLNRESGSAESAPTDAANVAATPGTPATAQPGVPPNAQPGAANQIAPGQKGPMPFAQPQGGDGFARSLQGVQPGDPAGSPQTNTYFDKLKNQLREQREQTGGAPSIIPQPGMMPPPSDFEEDLEADDSDLEEEDMEEDDEDLSEDEAVDEGEVVEEEQDFSESGSIAP